MTATRQRIGRATIRILGRLLLLIIAIELLLHSYLWWCGEQNVLQNDPTFGWRVRPHLGRAFRSSEGPYILETNSRGHRDQEHPIARSAAARRILLIGSSTVFGDGVDQHQMFSEVLERSLPQTEVINFSIPSVSAERHFLMLREEGIQYCPDVVIQFLLDSDATAPFWPWSLLPLRPKAWLGYENDDIVIHPPKLGFASRIVQSSNICQFGMYFALLSLPNTKGTVDVNEQFLAGQAMSREAYTRSLRRLLQATCEICHINSAEYVVVYLPSAFELSGETNHEGDFLREDVLARMEADEGLRVINLIEPLTHAQRDGVEILDTFHLNSKGHEIISETLARYLMSMPLPENAALEVESQYR